MPVKLGQICDLVNGELFGDPDCSIASAGPAHTAGEGQITFMEKGPHLKLLDKVRATAAIVPRGVHNPVVNIIQVDNPRVAFAKALHLLYPPRHPLKGIHASATVGGDVVLGENLSIGPGVVIGDRVTIGNNTVLYPHVVINDDVVIGDDTIIYPHVAVLEGSRIGCRVIVHAGTVIGSDGFGFVMENGRHLKIPQTGIVQIDDDVEIGANNTIDRASFGQTWIQEGVKTDNQVHIAHNVVVGAHSIIVAQVGIAGSTTIGHHVILAGKSGIGGHLTIGDEVIVGPRTGIAQNVPDKQIMTGGMVAMPHGTWLRLQKVLPSLPELVKQVRKIGKRLSVLERNTKMQE